MKKTFERWLKGDRNGRRSGKPRSKGKDRYRSFTFPQLKPDCADDKFITLPKIGAVKLILHRPLPDEFKLKTATITRKADGWYVSLSLEDQSVPALTPDAPTAESIVGIDVGLKSFLVTSESEAVAIPQPYRKAEKRLKQSQRQLSKKKKGSQRRAKAVKQVAKAHLKVANQRKDFHYKTSKWLLSQGKHIAHEDLNLKGLATSRLAKSVYDAGWLTIAVNPNGTSQHCSDCGQAVPKTIADRWHSCPQCGAQYDRDHKAARTMKQRAVGHPPSKLLEVTEVASL